MKEIIEYQIARGYWFLEDDFAQDGDAYICRPSKTLDERMFSIRTFKTKEDALEYANRDFSDRYSQHTDWLAYYVIYEVRKTIIKEFFGMENIDAPIYEW